MNQDSVIYLGCQEGLQSDDHIPFATFDQPVAEHWKKCGIDSIDKLFFEPISEPDREECEKAAPALSHS